VPAQDKIQACAVSQESTNVASVTIQLNLVLDVI
jgi:hypothetical protein